MKINGSNLQFTESDKGRWGMQYSETKIKAQNKATAQDKCTCVTIMTD